MSQSFTTHRADLLKELDGFRVEIDADAKRADLILDRAPFNIVRMPQRPQMAAVIDELDHDDRVRVIVIRSEGKHFSSGGDIPGFMEASQETVSQLHKYIAAPERCSKLVIAAVRGYCFGVGFELSLACDFRIVSETAEMALPEMRIGMIPGSGGSARLEKMIGVSRAKNVSLRSLRIPGKQAEAWGIAAECVPDDQLDAAVAGLVKELCQFSPLAQRTLKNVLNHSVNSPLEQAMEIEGQAYGRLRGGKDFAEGVASFVEKRRPTFTGE
ncbi:MAG: enoyl-CoA hydratase/isomerase family protein [Alphaproteobacteria bacterium]|jgi:2-oxoglutaroyl-CoA hydrolase